MAASTWTSVVVSVRGRKVTLTVDGDLVGSNTFTSLSPRQLSVTTPIQVGQYMCDKHDMFFGPNGKIRKLVLRREKPLQQSNSKSGYGSMPNTM